MTNHVLDAEVIVPYGHSRLAIDTALFRHHKRSQLFVVDKVEELFRSFTSGAGIFLKSAILAFK